MRRSVRWNEIKLVGIQEYFKKQYPQLTIDYDMLGGESLLSNLDEYVKEKGIDVLCLSITSGTSLHVCLIPALPVG